MAHHMAGDHKFEVNIFPNFKSCYKWNIYLALSNMYLDIFQQN